MKIKLTENQYQKLLNEMRFDGKSTGLFGSEEPEESKPINEFGEKFKKGWSEFLSAAKREGKETAIAAEILKRMVTRKKVSKSEKKFLKNQSVDLLKIVGVVGLGVVSSVIPIALEKILNKKDMSIMPSKQEPPKEDPETGEDYPVNESKKKKGNMNCRNCNWRWDIEEDDTDPSLCHKCGYNSELGKFDMGSLKKWKEDNNSPFKEYAEEGYHIKKKLNEDNHLFHHTKKNDENFYRKALNYLVKNKGGNVMKSLSQYLYCRELHCLPLTQTNGFKKVINFLSEEFQINKDEQQLLFLLLIFNLDVKNFLTDPLDYGKGYKLYHVSHTAQSIEQDDDWEEDDCQMCDGEGVINYQDYDTPQQCEDCIGSGMVHNQTISYRLDYYMSSFLSKNSLIIPDGEFSEDEFISINKDNDIIHYKEKLDEVIYSHSRHFDEEVGMVLSIESANYFDIHDLDLTTL